MYTVSKSLKRTSFVKHLIYTEGIGNMATMVSMRSMHVAPMILPSCSVLVDGVGHVNPSGFKTENGHQKMRAQSNRLRLCLNSLVEVWIYFAFKPTAFGIDAKVWFQQLMTTPLPVNQTTQSLTCTLWCPCSFKFVGLVSLHWHPLTCSISIYIYIRIYIYIYVYIYIYIKSTR